MTQPTHPSQASPAGIRIRPATLFDLPTLRQFEQGVVVIERPMDPTIRKGPVNYYNLEAMLANPDLILLVAELDIEPSTGPGKTPDSGKTLIGSGYARIDPARLYLDHSHHAYLGFMYTHPAHRGKGVNQLIIAALRAWALSRHLTELRLDVYIANEAAIRAYEKAGFTPHLLQMRSRTEG